MRALRILALATMVFIFAGCLFGGPIHSLGDQDPTGVFATSGSSNYVRGWTFLVGAGINVTQLGAVTPHEAGEAFTVVLWDFATETQLATSDFVGAGSATWQWNDLASPVALTSGSTYLVSIFSVADHYYFGGTESWRPTGTITYLDMRYANSATVNTFPTSVLSAIQYGVPDIGYAFADTGVPEPGTLGLAGLALAALVLKRRG